jgi:hypothetical protein
LVLPAIDFLDEHPSHEPVRIAPSIENSLQPPRPGRALTILEMLVSTAMLTFIVLGLTAMFIQTQKAFKTGIKQSDSTDAGRAVIDLIASDLVQMSDPHFTNVPLPTGPVTTTSPTNFSWQLTGNDLYQTITGPNGSTIWTNQLNDLYILVQTNSTWYGVGYAVSNWFTNGSGGSLPGVGTLYRYITSTNGPLTQTNPLYGNIQNDVEQSGAFNNCHPVANGVVDLKITAYDAQGNMNTNQLLHPNSIFPFSYPVVVYNPTNLSLYITNYLPHAVDIELGVLEPEAFEHARALYTAGATAAAQNYLAGCAGQVQIFRQHIIIPAAP